MLLVDSLYINSGGGLVLLNYLVKYLQRSSIDFFLLFDARNPCDYNCVKNKLKLTPSVYVRFVFYSKNRNQFAKVLCFANIPTPIKMDVPVYTYFHNINIMTLDVPKIKDKLKYFFLRNYIRCLSNHTTIWMVQTTNTAFEIHEHLNIPNSSIRIIPFYDIEETKPSNNHGNDYVFIGEYTGSKGHDELLKAWEILHRMGVDIILHLTCSQSQSFLRKIDECKNKGVLINNHGKITHKEVDDLYLKSKALIYPSHNESLGLGIIEAINSGCDVISSDLPFTHAICYPSVTFNPTDPQSISEAVIKYETGTFRKSILKISNDIDILINYLR